MDREFWERALSEETRWPCPTCRLGHLRVLQGSLKHEETVASRESRQEDDWDPDWITYRFVVLLRCDNSSCAEPAVVHGEGHTEPEDRHDPDEGWSDMFYPRFVFPCPDLFAISKACPPQVATQIRRAFVASWGDYAACANQIRIALESLLTERGVPRYSVKNGRRNLLTLHARIDKFAASASAKTKHLSDLMKAVKWLGNSGSHSLSDSSGSLTRSDVFDGFDLFQYVLDELYAKSSIRLKKLAKEINRRKGPARKH